MQIYKIGVPDIAIAPLVSQLKSSLAVGPTLWIISGGSNIPLSVEAMKRIDYDLSSNLTVALADERFGDYGHPDSNWTQLKVAGFDPKHAKTIEALSADNPGLEATLSQYSNAISMAFYENERSVGQFGMGADGHIAGILPGSVASNETSELVVGYQSQPFTRITLTFEAIRHINVAFLIAGGATKRDQLIKLTSQDIPLSQQPAQIIKQNAESYIYNDQIEGGKQ